MKEFITRTTTAVFLIIFAYFSIVYLPDTVFSALIFFIIALSVYEFLGLTVPNKASKPLVFLNGALIAVSFSSDILHLQEALFISVFSFGLFFLFSVKTTSSLDSYIRDFGIQVLTILYLFFPLYFLYLLRKENPNYLFFLLFVIAVGDSGAYFLGKALGKHKIYPIASPNKSFEGIIAAVLTAGLSGWLSIIIFPVDVSVIVAILTASVIGLVSQLSDPVESLFKRASGKKDSGSLLPGHGGVLDRVDSYIFCAPLLFFIIRYIWI